MGFKKSWKAATKCLKNPFQQRSKEKTWINAGLTPALLTEEDCETDNHPLKGVDQGVTLALKRIQSGECPFCGIPTHRRTLFGSMRALTVGGNVINGHCLLCFPVAAFTEAKKPKTANRNVDKTERDLESDMVLSVNRDRGLSFVSELSGSYYCDINELT
eukprot:scaffold332_cov117-Cylindrotheca_fusiformis.AAC.18